MSAYHSGAVYGALREARSQLACVASSESPLTTSKRAHRLHLFSTSGDRHGGMPSSSDGEEGRMAI